MSVSEPDPGGELIPGLRYREFVEEALSHVSEASFRASPLYRRFGPGLMEYLTTPRIDRFTAASEPSAPIESSPAMPVASHRSGWTAAPLRVVHWNIEKGKALAGLLHHFAKEPRLRDASLWCLNEVDNGTARAGPNADVARELARALGCSAVLLPSFLECTKGLGEELLAPGENRLGIHGLAILSRLPVLEARAHPLPPCFDYFSFAEKRFGFRQGLYVRLDWNGRSLIAGTTHLEVRRTPGCRSRQIRAFLEGLDRARAAWGSDAPVVVTGDWNTHTFRRGGPLDSLGAFVRIMTTSRERLDGQLRAPFGREPLLALVERAGLEIRSFNDETPTASQDLGTVEDLGALPEPVARWLLRTFRLPGRVLRMRLDWIAGRGLRLAGSPWTLPDLSFEGARVSDHAPIGVALTSDG